MGTSYPGFSFRVPFSTVSTARASSSDSNFLLESSPSVPNFSVFRQPYLLGLHSGPGDPIGPFPTAGLWVPRVFPDPDRLDAGIVSEEPSNQRELWERPYHDRMALVGPRQDIELLLS